MSPWLAAGWQVGQQVAHFWVAPSFFCTVVKEVSSKQNLAWQLRVKWAEKSKSHPGCEHLIFKVDLPRAEICIQPPPTPRLSFSAGGAQPSAPSNIQTSTYTKGALKHLTVVFDFLGLKHPPGSPGGWWQVIRLNHSDNKAIWNLIQQELVDKSQHFEALDAPHQLDLLPLRDW